MKSPVVGFAAFVAVVVAGAGAWAGNPAAQVGELRVEENVRTAAPVILGAAGVKEGDRFGPETAAEVKQRVLNLRLFREVTVVPEARGREVDVSIRVLERWTLLPVPIVTVSSRGIRGGIYVLESTCSAGTSSSWSARGTAGRGLRGLR